MENKSILKMAARLTYSCKIDLIDWLIDWLCEFVESVKLRNKLNNINKKVKRAIINVKKDIKK